MYDEALLRKGSLRLVGRDGSHQALDLARYGGSVDGVDSELCDRCEGPTLDVGCGPGRFVAALMARGVPCLGVDVAPKTVAAAQANGTNVIHGSVFAPLPNEGGWSRVLLLDENVGIGGRPGALLRRVHELLAPGGLALVETDARFDRDDRAPGPGRGRARQAQPAVPVGAPRQRRRRAGRSRGRSGAPRPLDARRTLVRVPRPHCQARLSVLTLRTCRPSTSRPVPAFELYDGPIEVGPELTYGEVPDAGPDAELDPHWIDLRAGAVLPAVYMPPAMGSSAPRPPWLRAVAVVLVVMFLGATAAGVCLTYGPPHLWP